MHPPPRAQKLRQTYILKRTVRQVAVPLVLHVRDLSRGFVVVDEDFAVDDLFFVDAFNDVARAQVEADGVPSISDFVVQSFDRGEGCLETVLCESGEEISKMDRVLGESECGCKARKAQSHPLRLELFAAHGFGDGIFKHAVVGPELEFLQ